MFGRHRLSMRGPLAVGILVAVAGMTVGCADSLDSMLKSSNSGPGAQCDADDDGKTWDLGTGRIEDIKRLAPGFFTANNGRWRRQGLTTGITGVSGIEPAIVDGAEAFQFVTKEAPYRVRALRIDNKVAILATPGQCPHVKALDRCVDDRLTTKLLVKGTAPCLGPLTVPEHHVTIALGNNEAAREQLVFGEPFMVPTNAPSISFALYLGDGKEPAGFVERRVNDYSKALPDEVLAFLRHGHETAAGLLYRNVPAELKTSQVADAIAEARAEGVTSAASSVTTIRDVNDLIKSHPQGVLPGDAEMREIIVGKVKALIAEHVNADPKPDALFTIALLLRLMEPLTPEKPNLSALESKYGPLLNQPGFNDPKVQGSFMGLLPDSKYTRALEAEEAKEAQQAEVDARKQSADRDTEEAWLEVQGRGDEIATLAYKIRFGQQNFVQSRHNQRGLATMQKYREGLVRDAFCPAKRAFVKAAGAGEYSRRAAEHCSKEAPIDVGVGGVEKTLTAECRGAFATGC